jgi:urease subunit alpha
VLWDPTSFGAKPCLVLKAGFPAYGVVGDPNASTDRCEPLVYGPQFGGHGATAADLSVAFVAQAAVEQPGAGRVGDGMHGMPTRRRRVGVRGTRGIGPGAMVRNTRVGAVRVAAATGLVTLDGEPIESGPADTVPLSRLYFL